MSLLNRYQQKLLSLFQNWSFNSVLVPLVSLFTGLLGAAIIIAIMGVNPVRAYSLMFLGAFGSIHGLFGALQRFVPLAFGGLAVTLAFKAGVFNIGVEGQLYIGALVSTWVAVSFPSLPFAIHLPLALMAGCIGGAFWAFIPGYLKATKGFNEIIISIFMNFIAIFLVGASLGTFLRAPEQPIPWSSPIPHSARIPWIPGTSVQVSVFLAIILAVLMAYLLRHRTIGYEIKVVGYNKDAANFGGINSRKIVVLVMILSGAIGSLAGSTTVLGLQYRLTERFLVDYGYNAIPVALLGGLNPYGVLVVAFLYGALLQGGSSMQVSLRVPVAISQVIMALAILAAIGMHGAQRVVSLDKILSRRTRGRKGEK